MSSLYPFFAYLFIFLIFFLQRKCWRFVWDLNGYRGIYQQPILWFLLICHMDPKSIMTSIHRFGKYFQFPLAIILFDRTLLYVDDPVTMEGILTAPECLNKTFLQNGFFANKGLLHAKDEQWKIRRKQLNPAFSHNTLISFLGDFNRVANELANMLHLELQHNGIQFRHLEDLTSRAVLEVSCLTIMGVETHFTESDEKGIAWAYRYLMELAALRILKPWYQIDFVFRFLDKHNYDSGHKANKMVQEFVANIVKQKLNTPENIKSTAADENISTRGDNVKDSNENMSEQRIFIDQLLYLAQLGKITIQDIMDEAQSMVVVSFETVSTCVMNVLLCLALNLECQTKLRQEIQRVLSKNPDTKLQPNDLNPFEHVTITQLQNMPYLDMILNESLRLLATVPMNLRNVSADLKLKILERDGNSTTALLSNKLVTVPKDTMIALDTFNMQRNEEFWGSNALKFHPEHFLKMPQTDNATTSRHSYGFIPFSKGLRTCIGHRYSIYLSKILLIKLISSFVFTTNIHFEDLQYYEGVSLKYRNSKDIHFEIHQVTE